MKSVDDPQFKDKFEDTFTGSSLTSVPWYVCAGNHDYYGGDAGINAEIAYSNKSKRWVFPDKYYSKEITTKDGTSILLVSTDTWRLNGGDTFVKFDPKTEKSVLRSKELVMTSHKEGRIHKETRDLLIANFPEDDPATDRSTGRSPRRRTTRRESSRAPSLGRARAAHALETLETEERENARVVTATRRSSSWDSWR